MASRDRKRRRSDESSASAERQPKQPRHGDDSGSESDGHPSGPPPQPPFGPSLKNMLNTTPVDTVYVSTTRSRSNAPSRAPSPAASAARVYPPPYSFSENEGLFAHPDIHQSFWMGVLIGLGRIDQQLTGYALLIACLQLIFAQAKAMSGAQPNAYFVDQSAEYLQCVLENDVGLSVEIREWVETANSLVPHRPRAVATSIAYHMFRPADTYQGSTHRVTFEDEQCALLVRNAWEAPLLGATDIKLVMTLQAGFRAGPEETRDYSNSATMLQSSGTGKTRSAHEAGKFIFSFPVVLRPGDTNVAFPSADVSIRDLMTKSAGDFPDEKIYPVRYAHIMRLLAAFATQILDGQTWTEVEQPRAYLEKVNAWNVYINDDGRRKALYDLVAARVEEIELAYCKEASAGDAASPSRNTAARAWLDPNSARAKQALKALHDVLRDTSEVGDRMFEGDELLPETLQYALSDGEMKDVRLCVNDLARRWKRVTGKPISTFWPTTETGLFVLVYFDEAHVLFPPKNRPVSRPVKSQYDYLLSVLNDLLSEIFGLFLSTSSHLRRFAPPAALAASERYSKSKFLQPPITECPFDCFARNISISTLKLEQLSTIEFMAQFGRPLFWTMLHADADTVDEETRIKLVMRLAVAKLSGLDTQDIDHFRWYSANGRLAVLDERMCLDYEPRKFLSIELEAELVATHLRLAYSVPEDRLYIYSGYSSEPLLAEAAARIMRAWMWHWSNASLAWNPLEELAVRMNESLLDRGERGEVVGRYILIHAYDLAMIIVNNDTVRGWSFSAGCPLNTFIRGLFCESTADDVLAAYPDNIATNLSETLGEAFELAYVRFTHFAKLIDTSGLTTVGLAAAFIRGMAFIAKAGQIFVDLIIPVLLDYTKPVSPENMTAILVQIKRRVRAGTTAKYNYTAEELGLFEDSDPKPPRAAKKEELAAIRNRPYITLLLELGVKPVETPSAQAAKAKGKGKGKGKAAPPPPTTTKPAAKAKAKAPAQTKAKPSTKAGSSKVQAQSSNDSGDRAVASSSAGPSASGPAMATRARTKAQTAAPSKQPVQTAPSTQTGKTASTKKTATSKVLIGTAPERQSLRVRKNLPHPRYNIRVYGCSENIYNVFNKEDRSIVERILLSKLTMFEEHPRKDRIADVWNMKPVWAAPDSFSWSDRVPIVNDQPVEHDDGLVEIERYAGGDDGAEDEDGDIDE